MVCEKEILNRDKKHLNWEEIYGNPKSGRFKKTKASLKRWNADRQLANCLSRYDRKRRNDYNFERRRQNSLLGRVRPSWKKRVSSSLSSMTKALDSMDVLLKNVNDKFSRLDFKNLKEILTNLAGSTTSITQAMTSLDQLLKNADVKLSQVDIDEARRLMNTGESLLAKISEVNVQDINNLAKNSAEAMTTFSETAKKVEIKNINELTEKTAKAMNTFVENKGKVKIKMGLGGRRVPKKRSKRKSLKRRSSR